MKALLSTVFLLSTSAGFADTPLPGTTVDTHVLPGYETLAAQTAELSLAAATDCSVESPDLVAAYHDAFDAWIAVSHLRFGPSERNDRAFALAFWPDPRSATPKGLAALIADQDTVAANPDEFATVSVALRGFYALEQLLFDSQLTEAGPQEYICQLVRAIANDIAQNASEILLDWKTEYGNLMANPGNATYRTPDEALQQFFTALSTGLEFTAETRLGRPLGTFDRPRPNRAEARRSGRSLRNVIGSLTATKQLAEQLSMNDPKVEEAFNAAIQRATELDDPILAGVASPQERFRIEVLKQDIDNIRRILAEQVGPSLGIAAGFNSLDGD